MIKVVEGLLFEGEPVTAVVEFVEPFSDTWIVEACFEYTGIPLEELELEYLRNLNHARLNSLCKQFLRGADHE